MIITEFLERNARYHRGDTAIVEINPSDELDHAETWREASLIANAAKDTPYRREMTWKEFNDRANHFANLLLSRGVKRGTKVSILLMNCIEWLPIYFGVLKAGCVVVPLNYRYSGDEIDYCLKLAEADILVFGPEFIERIDMILDKLNLKMMFFVGAQKDKPIYAEDTIRLMEYCSSRETAVELKESDLAAIYFSSGTTGFPKAILHNHGGLTHAAIMEQKHHGQTKNDCFLLIPPLYHTGAKMHWFGSLVSGSKAVILRGIRPEWILRAVTEERCTIVWLLVPWAQDILDQIESGKIDLNNYLLDQWRLMHIGAQPVPPSLIKRWKKYFPNHDYDTNYGLSESLGPGCVHLGVENYEHVGAIGKAGYGYETKIVDENGNEVGPEEVGELIVKGPSVMLEYFRNPEETKKTVKDGWLYTGDMAKTDKDGFIYLVDRKKDVIITGGENLYPVQIEDFIRANDKVKDVAVIGVPDTRLGEIAAAIIEVKDGCTMTEDEVNEFCMGLPRYKRPRKIIFEKIPRNPTGKIEKPVLRKKYCGGRLVEEETKN